MQIVYTGPEPELEVELFDGGWTVITKDVPFDVSDIDANGCDAQGESGDPDYQCARAGLLARDDFAPVSKKAPKE